MEQVLTVSRHEAAARLMRVPEVGVKTAHFKCRFSAQVQILPPRDLITFRNPRHAFIQPQDAVFTLQQFQNAVNGSSRFSSADNQVFSTGTDQPLLFAEAAEINSLFPCKCRIADINRGSVERFSLFSDCDGAACHL